MGVRIAKILGVFTLTFAVGGGTLRADDVDVTMLGGDLTSSFTDRNAIQLTAPNVSDETLRTAQLTGFEVFHRIETKKTGLGPFFNHDSCGSCHVDNGRGSVNFPRSGKGSTMVIKVALKGLNSDGSPKNVPKIGEQLLDHNLKRERLYDIKLSWRSVSGTYPDGTKYTLRKPRLEFFINGKRARKFSPSLRMTPPVIGPGLLEAVSEETVLGFSDPDDSNNDGISGRPQYVINRRNDERELGRFGFRASHPTLEQQSAAASANDIGVTNPIFRKANAVPEMSEEDLHTLTIYQILAGVPAAQNQSDPEVILGKGLFSSVGCDDCHKMTITTGTHQYAELSNQEIHPFTDLLLHDMGPGLADKRAEFEASGSEWRTTPLWGLGFSTRLSDVNAKFLHDGRARTIEEAILWHGGEGENSKNNFMALDKSDRDALIKFLNSL